MRILLVKRDKIGDMLLTTPLMLHLRALLPSASIDVLATDYNAWVVKDLPGLNHCWQLPRLRIGRTLRWSALWPNLCLRLALRRQHYDIVLIAQGEDSPRAIERGALVRSQRVIAYAAPPTRYGQRITDALAPASEDMHEVDRLLALLEPLGLDPTGAPAPRFVPDATMRDFAARWLAQQGLAADRYVILGLGARRAVRQPSVEQIRRWSTWWRERWGLATVFIWTPGNSDNPVYPGDDEIAEPVLRLGLPQFYPYRGPIAETLGLIWSARASVIPDSGLMHFAAASPGGVLGLFASPHHGPPAVRWAPRGARAS